MTPAELQKLKLALPTMGTQEKLVVIDLLEEYEKRKDAERARGSLLAFVMRINPAYKIGAHHRILADKLEKAARGEIDRLATAIAPRFGKSLLLSLYFPAWFMGNYPEQKLIIASHTADLAVDFGRKVRNLMDTEDYKLVFPGVKLSSDSKSAGRWTTDAGGEFYASGVGGALAGRGADLCLQKTTLCRIDGQLRAIGSAKVGQHIATNFGPQKITAVSLTIHKAGVKINNAVTASLEHPFLTEKGWVHAGALQVGNRILTTPFWKIACQQLFFRLKNLHAKHGKA